MSEEWTFAQTEAGEGLARLHFFSVTREQSGQEVEFTITVKEFVTNPDDKAMRFFAQADKETNQGTAPFTPCGWGASLLKALSECLREIRRFPYEPQEPKEAE